MSGTTLSLWIAALAFLAGTAQSVSPDRWFPAAFIAFRQGRSLGSTARTVLALSFTQILIGGLLFFALGPVFERLSSGGRQLTLFAMLIAVAVARWLRFKKMHDLFRGDAGLAEAFLLAGGAELMLPLGLRAFEVTGSLEATLTAFAAFALGSTIALGMLVLGTRRALERPRVLPRLWSWAEADGLWLGAGAPALALLLLGLGVLR